MLRNPAQVLACLIAMLAISGCGHAQSGVLEHRNCADVPVSPPAVRRIPEERVRAVIHVDGQRGSASDRNPGTADRPVRTIGRAIQLAEENNRRNTGTKILISPGIYREQLSLPVSGVATDAPIVLQARQKGAVVISGSDVWAGWQKEQRGDVYSHAWPYRWGLAPIPGGWDSVSLKPVVRRREMVFVNGQPLRQVLSEADLAEQCFYVSESQGRVLVRTAPGVALDAATVEVAVRSLLLRAQGRKNLVLRGLQFVHASTPLEHSAVEIVDASGVLIEDCQFSWNSWDGLGFLVSEQITARRNMANHNGATGFGGYQLKNIVLEDNESSQNNWRGAQGGFLGWALAGSKFLAVHGGLFRGHKALDNPARGLWLDSDNVNVLVEGGVFCRNQRDGIFIEASQGPVEVRNCVVCENKGSGLLGASSLNVTLANNRIYGNALAQLQITGDADRRVTNWETSGSINIRIGCWNVRSNAIASTSAQQLLLTAPDWKNFFDSLLSHDNLWHNAGNGMPFRIGNKSLSFADWRRIAGGDAGSVLNPAGRPPS